VVTTVTSRDPDIEVAISFKSSAEAGIEHCNSQITTVVIGQFCAHLISAPTVPIDGYEGIDLFRIWPTGSGIGIHSVPIIPQDWVPWLHEAFTRENASR
jgi:hypothetical protein